MTPEQIDTLKRDLNIPDGQEWEPFAGLGDLAGDIASLVRSTPFGQPHRRQYQPEHVAVPTKFDPPMSDTMSTQLGFGRLLAEIARAHPSLADRIVTTSPDVTVSTNLGGWVNRRAVFDPRERSDAFRDERIVSAQNWTMSPRGQHIELGIAENNFFILLAALGLAGSIFDARLLPIGTVYDPFVCRGLDALNYGCYQDARFLLVGTPSGITLAPEGGAHQSVYTPLIGIGQPGLTMFEPAYVDELCEIVRWSFEHLQADDGGSVYLRLSTRPIAQPTRTIDDTLRHHLLKGAYWLVPPDAGAELAIVTTGSVVVEALEACRQLREDLAGVGVLVVTSADVIQSDWRQSLTTGHTRSHVEELLNQLSPDAALISVIDGHPATLAWLGAVRRQPIVPLGVDHFGQSGDIPDLYRHYGIDADAIVEAAARILSRDAGF
jgi:pyruvate dehydrogenase E1 component